MWEESASWKISQISKLRKFSVHLIWTIKKTTTRQWVRSGPIIMAVRTRLSISRPRHLSWLGRQTRTSSRSGRQWISWGQITSKPQRTFISLAVTRDPRLRYNHRNRCFYNLWTRTCKHGHRRRWWTRRTSRDLLPTWCWTTTTWCLRISQTNPHHCTTPALPSQTTPHRFHP